MHYHITRGQKRYEKSNHLGNVLVTISDIKVPHGYKANSVVDYYTANIISAQDYYPFGSIMPGRNWSNEEYRFGFNGMEKDNELKGEGNSLDFGARIYDSRLGRWMSLDPLMKKYPNEAAYNFVSNNPIVYLDADGKDKIISYTIITDEGTITTTTVQKNVVKLSYIETGNSDGSGGGGHISYTDVKQKIVIDLRTNIKFEESQAFNSGEYSGDELSWIEGASQFFSATGDVQTSGIMFTSGEAGGASPTKYKAKNDVPVRDIESLITYLSFTHFGKIGEIPKLNETLGAQELADKIKSLVESVESQQKENSKKAAEEATQQTVPVAPVKDTVSKVKTETTVEGGIKSKSTTLGPPEPEK